MHKRVGLALSLLVCIAFSAGAAFAAPKQQAASGTAPAQAEPAASTRMPRATPESVGISSKYLLNMLDEYERQNVELHSLLIAVDGKVIFEGFYNPYTPETPYIIHSLTKLFTNAAAGMAYTAGKLKMDDKVVDFFPDLVPKDASENLKRMTVKDLITMRSGQGREISGNEWRPLKTSWLEAFMKEPVPYTPGTKYVYSSASSYALSAMVQKATGKTAEDLLKDSLIKKLGIERFTWQKSPEGINSGGNGVMITPEDMLKFGQLYLNKGLWNGERILSEDWCDRALGLKDAYNDGQTEYAYHWLNRDNGTYFTAHGVFGQMLVVVPKLNMTVVMTAGTDARVKDVLNEKLIKPTLNDVDRNYDGKLYDALQNKTKRLNVLPLAYRTSSPLSARIGGKTFTIDKNVDHIAEIGLQFTADSVTYTMKDHRGTHRIKNGIGTWIKSDTSMTGNYLHHQYQNPSAIVHASAWWEDEHTLKLVWAYPEMAFMDSLTITLTDNGISMVRSVNINSKGPFGGTVRPEVKGKARR